MSTSLQSLLREYAIESGAIAAEEIGAEEITVVTDETLTELEEELQELAEATEKAADDQDKLIEASDAVVATEAIIKERIQFLELESVQANYNRQLQAMSWAGVIDAMEAYKFPAELIADIKEGVSFEADEGEEGGKKNAKEDVSLLRRTWDRIKKFFTAIWNGLVHAYNRFLDLFRRNVEASKRSVAVLEKIRKERTSSLISTDAKLKVKGFGILLMDGQVKAPESLAGLAKGFELISGLNGITNNLAKAKVLDDALREGKASLRSLFNELPKNASFAFSGGRELVFTSAKTGAKETLGVAVNLVRSKDGANVPEAAQEVAAPDIAIVDRITAEMTKLNVKTDAANAALSATADSLAKFTKTIEGVNAPDEADKAKLAEAQEALNEIKTVMAKVSAVAPMFLKEVHITSRAAFKYGVNVCKLYTKKGKEGKKEEPKKDEKKDEEAK